MNKNNFDIFGEISVGLLQEKKLSNMENSTIQISTHWTRTGFAGGGPRVVVSTAAFHAKVRGSVPGLGGLKETKNVSSPSTCESQYCGEPP